MANPSVQKRERERQRQDRQRDKDAKRQIRRDEKPASRSGPDGYDPDIANIVPGPQPTEDD